MKKSSKNNLSHSFDHESEKTIFCKIFSDRVSPHLCDIRRKELIVQDTFSCENCSNVNDKTFPASS